MSVNKLVLSEIIDKYITDYGNYIIAEQFPNYIDGLKIVIRRALWSAHKTYPNIISSQQMLSLVSRFHIHSPESTYKAIARVSQPFSILYPLFIFDSDFGSYSGDKVSSFRYTKLKISDFAYDVYFKNMKSDILKFQITEDLKGLEPKYLIPKIPMTLVFYSHSIGFGFTSRIISYKLEDINDMVKLYIDYKNNIIDKNKLIKKLNKFYYTFPIRNKIINPKNPTIIEGSLKFIKSNKIIINNLPYGISFKGMHDKVIKLLLSNNNNITNVIPASNRVNEGEEHITFKNNKQYISSFLELIQFIQYVTKIPIFMNYNKDGKLLQIQENDISLLLSFWYKARKRSIVDNIKHQINSVKQKLLELECFLIVADNSSDIEKIIKSSKDDDESRYNLKKKYNLSLNQCNILINTKYKILNKSNKDNLHKQIIEKKEEFNNLLNDLKNIDNIILKDSEIITNKYKRNKYISYIPKYIGYIIIDNEMSIWIENLKHLKHLLDIFKNKITDIQLKNSKSFSYGIAYNKNNTKHDLYLTPNQYSDNIRYIPKDTIPLIQIVMLYKSKFIEKAIYNINNNYTTHQLYKNINKETYIIDIYFKKNKLYIHKDLFSNVSNSSIYCNNISKNIYNNKSTFLIIYYISDLKDTIRFKKITLNKAKRNRELPILFNDNTNIIILDVIDLEKHNYNFIPLVINNINKSINGIYLLDKNKILNVLKNDPGGFKDLNITYYQQNKQFKII